MGRTTGVTNISRQEARRNEERVLAESSLYGERRVSIARLGMIALFALSQGVIGPAFGETMKADPYKMSAIGLYLFAALFSLQMTYRSKPNPRRARLIPIASTIGDFSFMGFVAIRDWQIQHWIHLEMAAIAFAMVLCFSVARYHWTHVVLSTVMAATTFLVVGLYTGGLTAMSGSFVLVGFFALGFLILMTNLSVKRMFSALRRRDNLSRFLPRQLVERVLELHGASLAPVQRDVTVLFSDIRGFTALSEAMPPREVLQLLDEYFGHMSQVVKGHAGIVNKFLGDGMLAVWNVPDRDPAHAENAMRAALDMRLALEDINRTRALRGEPALKIGIGVHTGPVAAGMLGGADQHEYTVIGDAVNLASRVEGLTKTFDVDILVSDSTWRLAAEGRFRGTALPAQKVKGRSEPVVVHALLELAASAQPASSVVVTTPIAR